jgi:hypothetical protein
MNKGIRNESGIYSQRHHRDAAVGLSDVCAVKTGEVLIVREGKTLRHFKRRIAGICIRNDG